MMNMDTASMDAAADRIEEFVSSECGILLDGGDDFGSDDASDLADAGIDPELRDGVNSGDQASILAAVFGIEIELAQCMVDELGLSTERTLGDLAMEELQREMCGTTGLDILMGG